MQTIQPLQMLFSTEKALRSPQNFIYFEQFTKLHVLRNLTLTEGDVSFLGSSSLELCTCAKVSSFNRVGNAQRSRTLWHRAKPNHFCQHVPFAISELSESIE